ncbi:hypothetical protein HGH93_21465 [Chitinophaga polysaccharea]|uniref:hypothetical protein n=1 Tax=Chitinophaga polysaccharea TaxID=1293035 RepID=UPI0014554E51|nr:hypothetical protein [Chitinophaga polysaccharea]NLR60693.1 hypothetical protein [Chitinophaga polysaccharea]
MEKSQTAPDQNTFGITSSTLLDTAYLESLFNNDPDKVTEIEQPAKDPAKTVAPDTKSTPVIPANAAPQESTIIEDASFLDGLTDEDKEPAEEVKPSAAPKSDNPSALQENEKETPSKSGSLQSNIITFGKELYQVGILTTEEGQEPAPVNNTEELIERLTQEKQKGAVQILENILSHFGPEYRTAFDAIYLNGVHPREYFQQAEKVASLEGLDLSVPENQKKVVRVHLRSLGWDESKIAAKIEKLENYQDLEEEARDLIGPLVANEKKAMEQQQRERQQELSRKAAMDQEHQQIVGRIIDDKMKLKEFDGLPFDEKTARAVSGYMLEKKWQLGDSQISDFEKEILDLSRPENRQAQIKVALIMHLLKIDPTLSRLQRKAVTKEADKMFAFLQREESTDKKQGRKRSNFIDD